MMTLHKFFLPAPPSTLITHWLSDLEPAEVCENFNPDFKALFNQSFFIYPFQTCPAFCAAHCIK